MTAREKILILFEQSNELTVKEIVDRLGISKQMVHLAIKQLHAEDRLQKLGSAPKTVYRLVTDANNVEEPGPQYQPTSKEGDYLAEQFTVVTESGNLLDGIDAFDYWCRQRKLPAQKTLNEFIETKRKYAPYYDADGMVDGSEKLIVPRFSSLALRAQPSSELRSILGCLRCTRNFVEASSLASPRS